MREQRPGVQKFRAVDLLPPVRRCPCRVGLFRQGMRWRAKAEYVEQKRLAVALPAITYEATFRRPSVRKGGAVVEHPLPVDAPVELSGKRADLALFLCIACEIFCSRQHPREEERRVDRRQFRLPGAASSLHVQEMVIEPLVTRRVSVGTLRAARKEAQTCERALDGVVALAVTALHTHGIRGKGEACPRDAGW